jgi:hypothetical protein
MRILLVALFLSTILPAAEPLSLHPRNPHYFLFRGHPTVLVTSGEHYGVVLNRDFDFKVYLDELKRRHLNLTRVWTGGYREVPGNFGIAKNTLAPEASRFLQPWPQTDGKFDLTKWDPAYFDRLLQFMDAASKRGVVVEMNLFCPFYEDSIWDVSPFNARNNVNGIGKFPRTEAYTLQHRELQQVQDELVEKVVNELRGFDNLYYEIANEPYYGGITLRWQEHIAGVIRRSESSFPQKHLISQNIANGSQKIEKPFEAVSIFNFHYSHPPESVAMNYGLNRVIGNNETGFDGIADATYRIQGWDFLMAGGALYNNLDYSFVVGHERGDFAYPADSPGGGSTNLREQLGILARFFESMPFTEMSPSNDIVKGARARVLAKPGVYAIYLHRGREVDAKPKYQVDDSEKADNLEISVPAGRYRIEWLDTKTGKTRTARAESNGTLTFTTPAYREDIAVRLTKR